MTLALTPDPARPLPGKPVKLTFAASVGNYVRVTCTDAPQGSALRDQLDETGATRVEVLEGDAGKPLDFTPDKPGAYLFAAQELTKGAAAYGGGYSNSPDAAPAEVLVGEQSFTLRVGTRLTMPMGTGPDTATLVLYVWDDTIRQTSEKVHGENSPAIISHSSDKARTAALSTGVLLRLVALVDQLASVVIDSVPTAISDLITQFDAHLQQATVHAANDADNNIDATYRQPTTTEGIKTSVAEIVRRLTQHTENNSGSGVASAAYHAPGGNKAGDWAAKLIARDTGNLAQCIITLADCWRCYEAHRVSLTVHNNADTANDAAGLPPLLDLHAAFLGSIASLAPTAPATANSGVVSLVSGAGMREG